MYEWAVSHMNEPCPIWMSRVTYKWAMSHTHDITRMNEQCVCVFQCVLQRVLQWCCSGVTVCVRVCCSGVAVSRVRGSCPLPCHIWMSHVTYECVMSHVRMSHVTYEWVMSHMNESCHIWMSRVRYEWVMSHMNASFHVWMSHVMYEWVMSRMNESCYIRNLTHMNMNESCGAGAKAEAMHVCTWTRPSMRSNVIYEEAMSRMNESCHIRISLFICMHESRMSHGTRTGAGAKAEATCVRIKMRHLIQNESCHTWRSHVMYELVVSHVWISYKWVTAQIRISHEWAMAHELMQVQKLKRRVYSLNGYYCRCTHSWFISYNIGGDFYHIW